MYKRRRCRRNLLTDDADVCGCELIVVVAVDEECDDVVTVDGDAVLTVVEVCIFVVDVVKGTEEACADDKVEDVLTFIVGVGTVVLLHSVVGH